MLGSWPTLSKGPKTLVYAGFSVLLLGVLAYSSGLGSSNKDREFIVLIKPHGSRLPGHVFHKDHVPKKVPASSVLKTDFEGLVEHFGDGEISKIPPDVLLRLGRRTRVEAFLKALLEHHRDVLLPSPSMGNPYGKRKGGLLALQTLSGNAPSTEQKVSYLREAIRLFPDEYISGNSPTKYELRFWIARIYAKDKATLSKAIAEYHDLIRTFPKVRMTGYEYTYLIGDYAASSLIRALKGSSAKLILRETKQILDEATTKQARVVSLEARVKAFIDLKKYRRAEAELKRVLRLSPSVIALRTIGQEYIGELGKPHRFVALCDKMLKKFEDSKVRDRLYYAKAFGLDFGVGSRDATLAEYEKSSMQDFMQPGRSADWTISRKDEIRTARPFAAELTERAELRSIPKSGAPIIKLLKKGAKATALYRNRSFFKGKWIKLETEKGKHGWVLESAIRLTEIASLPAYTAENSWTKYRANSRQTGSIDGSRISKPRLLWNIPNVNAHEVIYSDVNRDGVTDLIVAGYEMNHLAVLNGQDQSVIWKHRYEDAGRYGPKLERFRSANAPSVWGHWLVFASPGAIQWAFLDNGSGGKTLGANPSFSPLIIDGDKLFFKEYQGPLVAYDLSTHKTKWKSEGRACDENAAVVDAESKSVISCQFKATDSPLGPRRAAVAYSIESGKEKWWFGTKDISGFTPRLMVVGEKNIFVGDSTKGLNLLSKDSGKRVASLTHRRGYTMSDNVAVKDNIVVGTSYFPHQVNAFNLTTKQLMWKFLGNDRFNARLAISGETVYAGDDSGVLYALDLKTGKELWHYDAGDKILGAISTNGNLVSFTTNARSLFVIGDAGSSNSR